MTRICVLLVLALACSQGVALGAEDVLPPEAGEKIGAAFDRLAAPWVMDSAAIERASVAARVCRNEGGDECYELTLERPQESCSGTRLAAWCLVYRDDTPAELRGTCEDVFGQFAYEDFWHVPTRTTPVEGAIGEASVETKVAVGMAWMLGLATLILPLLLGLLAGWLTHRWWRRLRSWWSGVLVFVVALLPAACLPMEWLRIGFHDMVLMGALTAFGFVCRGHRWCEVVGRKELGLLVASGFMALMLGEAGVRLLLPRPPAFPPPFMARLVQPRSGGFPHGGKICESLFPEVFPLTLADRVRFPDRPRHVLHLGDSMLEGDEVPQDERTVYRLNELSEEVSHVDGGFSGVGADHYYLLSRRWAERVHADLVVWHVFLYNDVGNNMTHPYSCCGNLPPLSFIGSTINDRCSQLQEAGFFGNRVVNSPAPYIVRVATQFSYLARYLSEIAGRQARTLIAEGGIDGEEQVRFRAILQDTADFLRTRGIDLVVVMVPYRGEWEPYASVLEEQQSRREFVSGLCSEMGIASFDGRDAFDGPIQQEGVAPFFINEPVWDFHFSSRGQAVYAEWLNRVLPIATPR